MVRGIEPTIKVKKRTSHESRFAQSWMCPRPSARFWARCWGRRWFRYVIIPVIALALLETLLAGLVFNFGMVHSASMYQPTVVPYMAIDINDFNYKRLEEYVVSLTDSIGRLYNFAENTPMDSVQLRFHYHPNNKSMRIYVDFLLSCECGPESFRFLSFNVSEVDSQTFVSTVYADGIMLWDKYYPESYSATR